MDWIAATAFYGVMASWIAFGIVFKGPESKLKHAEKKRSSASYWGMLVEGVAYAVVWIFPRRYFSPIIPMPKPAEIAVTVAAILIAVASVWLCQAAVRALGKQWTYRARVIEGHELITSGPYSLVRNPIYLGMFGMLIATGLAVGIWPVLLAAIAIFLAGTAIRIRSEETLLREAFGALFEDYARRVPAFFPNLFR
jgi:protein-S-isoprenylcysteine O-methyltransferase Ste14